MPDSPNLEQRLATAERERQRLALENDQLRTSVTDLRTDNDSLRAQNDALEATNKKLEKGDAVLQETVATQRLDNERVLVAERNLAIKLAAETDIGRIAHHCLQTALDVSGMDAAGFYLVNPITRDVTLTKYVGLSLPFIEAVRHFSPESPQALLVLAGRPAYRNYKELTFTNEITRNEDLRAIAIVPILHENKTIASFNVASHTMDVVPERARKSLETIAAQVGGAIVRAHTQEWVRAFMEALPQAVYRTDRKGCIVSVNKQAFRMFGYPPDALKEGFNTMDMIVPEERAAAQARFRAIISGDTGEPTWMHYTGLRKDGTTFPMRALSFPDPQGGVMGILADRTEEVQRQQEKEIEQQKRYQSEKMEALGTFAAGIAHDTNNWLTPIVGNAEMISISGADESIKKRAATILQSGQHIGNLIQQILLYTKGATPTTQRVSLRKLIQESSQIYKQNPSITCNLDLRSNAHVMMSPSSIERILLNLWTNADHAMDGKGRIDIGLRDERIVTDFTLAPGDYVVLSVADTGCGMTPEVQSKIFDLYFTTKKDRGTGLGLPSVYGIVKQLRGDIRVQSKPGKGTTFEVWLPATGGYEDTEEIRVPNARPVRGRALFVDDELVIRDIVPGMLNIIGMDCETFSEPRHLLASLRERPSLYSLIITDLQMAGMNGYELAAEARAIRPDLPIIVSSGYGEAITHIKPTVPVAYLSKPFLLEDLARKIREVLNQDEPAVPEEPGRD